MIAQAQAITYTPAEYLAKEEKAEFRHECINGEIVPMAGGTINHCKIIRNLSVFLTNLLIRQNNQLG